MLANAVVDASHHEVVERFAAEYFLIKLAARCNINCTYCYWFRDQDVYEQSKILTPAVQERFLEKLDRHVARHRLKRLYLLFHGGEPLLFGWQRFDDFCSKLRALEHRTSLSLHLSITTNGLLIDEAWIDTFLERAVRVTISLDGPRGIHDRRRLDFRGQGTHCEVERALANMRSRGLEPGILAVCDPHSDPADVLHYFWRDVGVKSTDILVPDHTHDDIDRPSIANYYIRLFDIWYDEYAALGMRLRIFDDIIRALGGGCTKHEGIGLGEVTTTTLLPNGDLEPLDVLRVIGRGATRGVVSIWRNELDEIPLHPLWREVRKASTQLNSACRQCRHRIVCGGGHIASRWSAANRFDNPSVYCPDYLQIIDHIWRRIGRDLYLAAGT